MIGLFDLLNPAHPFRSKRVQGAALTLGSVLAGLAGWNVTEVQGGEVFSTGNSLIVLFGILWNQIGGLMAAKSPREF